MILIILNGVDISVIKNGDGKRESHKLGQKRLVIKGHSNDEV